MFCYGIGMTVESILERITQKPFRPIALETVDKTWIKVDREADIFIYDRTETAWVVVFDPEGRKLVFRAGANLRDRSKVKESNFKLTSPRCLLIENRTFCR